jgi:hypothetical protein
MVADGVNANEEPAVKTNARAVNFILLNIYIYIFLLGSKDNMK